MYFLIVMQTKKSDKVIAVSHNTIVNETIANTSSFPSSTYTIVKNFSLLIYFPEVSF